MAIYLEVEGIDGDVTDPGHEDWITAESIDWGVVRAIASDIGRSTDRESTQPSISEITVTKTMDISSPQLFLQACRGPAMEEVTIHICRTGEDEAEPYMEYVLGDCMISGYQVSSGGERPKEVVSLSFTSLQMTYTPSEKEGESGDPIAAEYDLTTATGG